MSHPLLLTKLLAPSPRAGIIMRQALVDRLNLDLNCRLTLISAPAGFGKTTLLSSWYEKACAIERSIDHALAAKDCIRALTLIGQIIEETFARGETATLLRWLERLPQEQL